jgi:hypothetical protein
MTLRDPLNGRLRRILPNDETGNGKSRSFPSAPHLFGCALSPPFSDLVGIADKKVPKERSLAPNSPDRLCLLAADEEEGSTEAS